MSKQKLTALLTALALVLGLCGASVLAAPDSGEADTSQSETAGDASSGADASFPEDGAEAAPVSDGSQEADSAGAGSQAGEPQTSEAQLRDGETPTEGEPTEDSETPEEDGPKEEAPVPPAPDPVGTISFANLGSRMRAGNLNCLILEENIAQIDAIDYKKLEEQLRDSLNGIASAQWGMLTGAGSFNIEMPDLEGVDSKLKAQLGQVFGQLNGVLQGMSSMMASSAASSLDAAYDSLRETFDGLRDGKLQKDNQDIIRQLRDAEDQVVMAGEALYIALADLEMNSSSLDRSLASLDRTVKELELRYDLGQVSALTLQETRSGRTTAASGKQTMDMNIRNMKFQLESMLGAELTGSISLQALPQVTGEQLNAMDLDADLTAAKAVSYSLYDAKKTLDNAYSDYKDAGRENGYNEKRYQFVQAQHAWQAAQYTYQNAVQTFELSFRTLYDQVKDYKQVLDAARTSLAVEKANLEATQLKYDQGTVSQNTLLTAQDDVATAQEKVDGAAIDLFSAYHNYRWAVDYGILN